MPKSSQAPATKADIKLLMGEIGKLYDATERWKDEVIDSLDGRMGTLITASEKRMKHHFDLAVEIIRAEMAGANKDKIEGHEHRIVLLEKHVGFAA